MCALASLARPSPTCAVAPLAARAAGRRPLATWRPPACSWRPPVWARAARRPDWRHWIGRSGWRCGSRPGWRWRWRARPASPRAPAGPPARWRPAPPPSSACGRRSYLLLALANVVGWPPRWPARVASASWCGAPSGLSARGRRDRVWMSTRARDYATNFKFGRAGGDMRVRVRGRARQAVRQAPLIWRQDRARASTKLASGSAKRRHSLARTHT